MGKKAESRYLRAKIVSFVRKQKKLSDIVVKPQCQLTAWYREAAHQSCKLTNEVEINSRLYCSKI